MTNLQFQRLKAAEPKGRLGQIIPCCAQAKYWRDQCERIIAEPVSLTEKQEVAFNALKVYDQANGRSPTLREFAALLSTNVSNAQRYMVALEERGHIKRLPGRVRAITILETGK